jgi:hypothetical protein
LPLIAPARAIVHPSFVEPGLIVTTSQPSGFADAFAGGGPLNKIGSVDKWIYINRLDLRTQVVAQQAAANLLPSCTIALDYIQTATYRAQSRCEYDDIDMAEAGSWNVGLPEAYRLAMRQGIFQYMRTAALFGVNASNAEGLLNTPGALFVNLPPDSYGDTTILTYDSGQLALFFLLQIQNMITRMYQAGVPNRIVILAPARILLQMQMTNIVQVTSYQRVGAGTATTAQIIVEMAKQFGYTVEFAFDDTLQGAGAASADAVIMTVPEAVIASTPGINTNVFAGMQPNLEANTLQYVDVSAPVEISTPIVTGIDVTSRMRMSSGWCIRSQAITVISIPSGR